MKAWLIILIIIAILVIILIIRNCYELHSLEVSSYMLTSDKLPAGSRYKIVFLSDLHGRNYGQSNDKLIELISEQHPDIILIGGDMFNASSSDKDDTGISCAIKLRKIAPVCYAMGNHEGLVKFLGGYGMAFDEDRLGRYYSKRLQKYGEDEFTVRWKQFTGLLSENKIELLDNSSLNYNENITATGLTLPVVCFKKRHPEPVTDDIIKACIGKKDLSRYNIILAHSPDYFDEYTFTGADLILSGHLHGGIMRLPKLGGVISPKFEFFPKYSCGCFSKGESTMIVTKGCGTHHVNIRLFNKPEIVVIELHGEK